MRKACRALLAFVFGATMVLVVAERASAAVGDLACTATAQANFVPPLEGSTTEAEADVTGSLTNCNSLNNNFPELDSATITGSGIPTTAEPGVPCALLLTIEGTLTIEWSPPGPDDSEVSFLFNTNPFNGTVTIEVEVTDGPLSGDEIVPLIVQVNPNLDCALNGLTSLSTVAAVAVFQ